MKRTIYLPEPVARRAEAYLQEHPGLTLSTLVQRALERELAPPDPRALLELAGLVRHASSDARKRAEDRLVRAER